MVVYTLNIIGGPNKWDLILGLFEKKKVVFDFASSPGVGFLKRDFPSLRLQDGVILTMVEREDGSCESWNFKAIFPGFTGVLVGYYNTRTRHGSAELRFCR